MKQIINKIVNSGDLLWEELYYISLGEELGILRSLGAAAGAYRDILKKGHVEGYDDAIKDLAPVVEEIAKQSYDKGSRATSFSEMPYPVNTVDVNKINKVGITTKDVRDNITNKSSIWNLMVGTIRVPADEPKIDVTPVIQPKSDVTPAEEPKSDVTPAIQQIEYFKGKKVLDEAIGWLSKKDLGKLNKEELEDEKLDAKRIFNSIISLKKQQFAEAANTGDIEHRDKYVNLADKYLKIASDRLDKIQDRIKELENNKTKGLVKDLIKGYEEREQQKKKKSSTPELSPGATQKLLDKLGNIPMPTPSPNTQRELENISMSTPSPQTQSEIGKHTQKLPPKKLFTSPVKKKTIKINLNKDGAIGIYKARVIDDSPNRPDIEYEFDELSQFDKRLRNFEGDETDRYVRSGILTNKKLNDSINFNTNVEVPISKAYYDNIYDKNEGVWRRAKKPTIVNIPKKKFTIQFSKVNVNE